MPVEYYLVNKKVLKGDWLKETFLTSIPSLCVLGAVHFTGWFFSIVFFTAAALIFWFAYIKDSRFDINIINE
jgi:hypothetical protein